MTFSLLTRYPQARPLLEKLLLGLYLNDGKRLRNHAGVLIEGGLPSSQTARRRINAIVESSLRSRNTQDSFAVLQSLITKDVEMKKLGIRRALRGVWTVVRFPARILGF